MAGPPDDDPTREESESQPNDDPTSTDGPGESSEADEPSEVAEPIETDDLSAADEPDDPTGPEGTSGSSDSSGGEGFEESPATATAASDGDGPGPDEQYCSSCGSVIKKRAEICPECGVRQTGTGSSGEKDRTAAGVFALLLGGIGAHKFYLGQTKMGILYLCFFWTGIPAIVGFIEGILYLTKSDEEFQRQYVN